LLDQVLQRAQGADRGLQDAQLGPQIAVFFFEASDLELEHSQWVGFRREGHCPAS
jgi:hypothetical protein